jgi:hypothetical protein
MAFPRLNIVAWSARVRDHWSESERFWFLVVNANRITVDYMHIGGINRLCICWSGYGDGASKNETPPTQSYYSTTEVHMANSILIGSRIDESSFSGLLTRAEMGQMHISSEGYGRRRSWESGSSEIHLT